MKIIERILLAFILVAIAMKFAHWPLAGFLFIISSSLLSMCYFPASVAWFGVPGFKEQRIGLSIFTGVALSIALTGVLFRMQHWSMSGFFLLTGSMSCIAVLISQFMMRGKRPELVDYERSMLQRTILIAAPTLLLYFTPARTLIRLQYRDDPTYATLMIERVEHPQDTAIARKFEAYRDSMMEADRRAHLGKPQ